MPPSNSGSIVLTGCGWVTPLAAGPIDDVFAAARQARPAPQLEQGYWAVADELLAEYPDLSREIQRDKGAWMTAIAFVLACRDASLRLESFQAERVGMVVGSALAGQLGMISFANEVRAQSARFVSPLHFPQTVGNYISGAIARGYDFRGPNLTLASGAASGLDAVVRGCEVLASGTADLVVAGGVDELSEDLARGLAEPGVVLSEGACLFVLERADAAEARGVSPLATVRGHSRSAVDAALPDGSSDALVSCTAACHPGAVFVENWIGRCFGASGAAAAAAAIGAADGGVVPTLGSDDPTRASDGTIDVEHLTAGDGSLPAVVRVDADGAHATTVELSITPGRGRASE